jgi:hypothetical protein
MRRRLDTPEGPYIARTGSHIPTASWPDRRGDCYCRPAARWQEEAKFGNIFGTELCPKSGGIETFRIHFAVIVGDPQRVQKPGLQVFEYILAGERMEDGSTHKGGGGIVEKGATGLMIHVRGEKVIDMVLVGIALLS